MFEECKRPKQLRGLKVSIERAIASSKPPYKAFDVLFEGRTIVEALESLSREVTFEVIKGDTNVSFAVGAESAKIVIKKRKPGKKDHEFDSEIEIETPYKVIEFFDEILSDAATGKKPEFRIFANERFRVMGSRNPWKATAPFKAFDQELEFYYVAMPHAFDPSFEKRMNRSREMVSKYEVAAQPRGRVATTIGKPWKTLEDAFREIASKHLWNRFSEKDLAKIFERLVV